MRDLTARQRRVLAFIVRHAADAGRPPTIREIGAAMGFRSTGTVRDYLRALEAKGAIRRERGRARGIAPLRWEGPPGPDPPGRRGLPPPIPWKSRAEARSYTRGIPILGRVAAGRPLLAEENVEGFLDIPGAAASGRAGHFALRVKGDSMTDAGILDGDTVVVRKQDTARHGEIVVALVDGEATVKRLRLSARRASLDPANARYRPISVGGETRIVGKVVGVWRTL